MYASELARIGGLLICVAALMLMPRSWLRLRRWLRALGYYPGAQRASYYQILVAMGRSMQAPGGGASLTILRMVPWRRGRHGAADARRPIQAAMLTVVGCPRLIHRLAQQNMPMMFRLRRSGVHPAKLALLLRRNFWKGLCGAVLGDSMRFFSKEP
jgi:hypothetical protein